MNNSDEENDMEVGSFESGKHTTGVDGLDTASLLDVTTIPSFSAPLSTMMDSHLPDSVIGAREELKAEIRKKQNKLVRDHFLRNDKQRSG